MNRYDICCRAAAVLAVSAVLWSCEKTAFDSGDMDFAGAGAMKPVAMIRNSDGQAYFTSAEAFKTVGTVALHIEPSRQLTEPVICTLSYGDASSVDAYNSTNGTSYVAYPEELVEFGDPAALFEGETASTDVDVKFRVTDAISKGVTYAIPVKVETDNENVVPGTEHLVFVKNRIGETTSSLKDSGIRLISCMETGTANPLFHLSFELEKSGKPLFDYVIVFSSHIVYDFDEKRIKIRPNSCQEAMSSNIEKYVKPLHDRGIKVILSLLSSGYDQFGKNTGVALSSLDDATCRSLAREIADYCEAYDLDGVFFDEEYSGGRTDIPGVLPYLSSERVSRLCYETKKAMPDKELMVYIYSTTATLVNIDGMNPSDYIDYALNDYGSWYAGNYAGGLPKSKVAPCSLNCAPSFARWTANQSNLTRVRNEGYGAFMAYCLDFATSTWGSQISSLKNIAKYLYDDNLVDLNYRPLPEW